MELKGLYKLKKEDYEKLIATYKDAFRDYPKLRQSFPDPIKKAAALEASLRFYVAYDMEFGEAFSTDEAVMDGICLVHSDNMNYSEDSYEQAGCYSDGYYAAMGILTDDDKAVREALFDAIDEEEAKIDIPRPHIYADFLGVHSSVQQQGRGRKLMGAACEYAASLGLPLMLFTNTDDDVSFYKSMGFKVIAEVDFKEFGYTSTYMLKEVDFMPGCMTARETV